jgi:hypothetical protein
LLVEVAGDGAGHEVGPGGELDGEALGQREGVAVQLHLVRGRVGGGERSGQQADQNERQTVHGGSPDGTVRLNWGVKEK